MTKMKITALGTLLMVVGCQENTKNEEVGDAKQKLEKTEIVTRSYSVKSTKNGIVQDTLQQMQSIIVDENGQELENIFYNLDGSIAWRDVYEYNSDGERIGSSYFENGEQTIYYRYENDTMGRRTNYKAYDKRTDSILYWGDEVYEEDGRLKKIGYIDGKGKFKWNYEYVFDQDGKELGYTYINVASGERFPSIYNYTQFNENDKWLMREIISNDTIQGIEIREFR